MPETGVPMEMFSVLASTMPGPKIYEVNGAFADWTTGGATGRVRFPRMTITTATPTPIIARRGRMYLRIIAGAPYFCHRRPRRSCRHPCVRCDLQTQKCVDRG